MDDDNMGGIEYDPGQKIELRNGYIYNVKIEGGELTRAMYFFVDENDIYFLFNDDRMISNPVIEHIHEIDQEISGDETELLIKLYRLNYFYYMNPYGSDISLKNLKQHYMSLNKTLQPYVLDNAGVRGLEDNLIKGKIFEFTFREFNIGARDWIYLESTAIFIGFLGLYSIEKDKTLCMFDIHHGAIIFCQISELSNYNEWEGDLTDHMMEISQNYKKYFNLFKSDRSGQIQKKEKIISNIYNMQDIDNIPNISKLEYEIFQLLDNFLIESLKALFNYVTPYVLENDVENKCKLYKIGVFDDEYREYRALYLKSSLDYKYKHIINMSSIEPEILEIHDDQIFYVEEILISELTNSEIDTLTRFRFYYGDMELTGCIDWYINQEIIRDSIGDSITTD